MNTHNEITIIIYEGKYDFAETFKCFIDTQEGYDCPAYLLAPDNILEDLKAHQPDIIFMDINISPQKCIESLRKIRLDQSDIPVIMLSHTQDYDDANIIEYIKNGAHGFIAKAHTQESVITAIEEVLQGGVYITPNIAKQIFRILQSVPIVNEASNLSYRETEILEKLSKGLSYKLIADVLDISRHTVNAHLRKIYSKLHVHSATEAVSFYLNEKNN